VRARATAPKGESRRSHSPRRARRRATADATGVAAEIERCCEQYFGAKYGAVDNFLGDSFEAARARALRVCERATRVAEALRDPFAPGAAAVLRSSDKIGDWPNDQPSIAFIGEALQWRARGCSSRELARLIEARS